MKHLILLTFLFGTLNGFSQELGDSVFTVNGNIKGADAVVVCDVFSFDESDEGWYFVKTYYFENEYSFTFSIPGQLYNLSFYNNSQHFDLLVIAGSTGNKTLDIEFDEDPEMKRSFILYGKCDNQNEYVLSRLK